MENGVIRRYWSANGITVGRSGRKGLAFIGDLSFSELSAFA